METTKDAFLCHSSSFRFSTNIKHRFFIYSSAIVVSYKTQVLQVSVTLTTHTGHTSFSNTYNSYKTHVLQVSYRTQFQKHTGYENDSFSVFFLGTNFFGVVLFFLGVP